MNEKAGVTCFLISNDYESLCVCDGTHWELSWMIDGNVVDCDG